VFFWERAVDSWIRWRTRGLAVTPLDRVGDGTRVKIRGRLDAGAQPLVAPISGRTCAAWIVEVQEWPAWETIAVEQATQSFVLRDDSSRPALVRAARASVLVDKDASFWPAQPTGAMRALLRRHDVREEGYFGSPTPYRYCEGVLEPGETITVVGRARLEFDPSGVGGSYREPPVHAVFDAAPHAPLWILDGPARWRLE
jgi:hypothetical protein